VLLAKSGAGLVGSVHRCEQSTSVEVRSDAKCVAELRRFGKCP
jgi:hypothetical protein